MCCCPSLTNEYFTMHYDFIGVIEQMECMSVCEREWMPVWVACPLLVALQLVDLFEESGDQLLLAPHLTLQPSDHGRVSHYLVLLLLVPDPLGRIRKLLQTSSSHHITYNIIVTHYFATKHYFNTLPSTARHLLLPTITMSVF